MLQNELISTPIGEYLGRLASDAPAPGGGSAAALTGALAAALGQMVCGLTAGKPKFAAVEAEIRTLAQRFERARVALADLVDEDAAAYLELQRAFAIDKADPRRRERIQQSAQLAAGAPLATATLAHSVLSDARQLAAIGNPNLQADIQSAQALAVAASQAALANVRANLPLLADESAAAVQREIAALESTV